MKNALYFANGLRGGSPAWGWVATLPLFIFILLLPLLTKLVPGEVNWWTITRYDWQRIAQLLVFSLVAFFSIWLPAAKLGEIPGKRTLQLILSVVFAGGLSLLFNQVPWWDGVHEIALMALAIVTCWGIWRLLAASNEAEWQKTACLFFVGSAALYLAIFLRLNSDSLFSHRTMNFPISFPAFGHTRFFSDYQVLLFPFLVHVADSRCHNPLARVCGWLIVFLFAMLFFYAGSRVVILGQIGVHLCLFVVLRRSYWSTLLRHVWAWGGGYALFLIFSQLIPSLLGEATVGFNSGLDRIGLSLREVIWSLAWKNMLDNPWLGIGPGEFSRQFNSVAAGPHNSVLSIGAEWGIPVLMVLLATLSLMLVRSLKVLTVRIQESNETSGFVVAAWQAFGALLLHSLVANVLFIPTSLTSLVLAAGMVCATTLYPAAISNIERQHFAHFGYGIFTLCTIFAIAALLVRDIPRLPERNLAYIDCMYPIVEFSPRFWQQGWLHYVCRSGQAESQQQP